MAVVDLPFRPGVIKDETAYGARGYAVDSDLIRWVRGKPQTLGGWTEKVSGIVGKVRAMHEWRSNTGVPRLAIATDKKLYVHTGDRLIDITPLRTGVAADSIAAGGIATTSGSSTVTLTANGVHDAVVGDTVYIGSAGSPVGGLTIGAANASLANNALRTIAGSSLIRVTHTAHGLAENSLISVTGSSDFNGIDGSDLGSVRGRVHVLDANSYQYDCGMVATATGSGGGGSLVAQPAKAYVITAVPTTTTFRINAGANASSTTSGGAGAEGLDFEWTIGRTDGAAPLTDDGTNVVTGEPLEPRRWTLDNFGEILIANIRGGKIFAWPYYFGAQLASAVVVPNSPDNCLAVAVTPERTILACGCTSTGGVFDPLLIRNCDIEDLETWAPTATNSAGSYRLGTGAQVEGVAKLETGVFIWTELAFYANRWVGADDQIYDKIQLGVDCGLLGPHCVAQREGEFFWISPTFQFHVFRGGKPQTLPNPNREWFEARVTQYQESKIYAFSDPKFEAVGWSFPADGELECSEYLRLDLPEARRDELAGWSVGTLARAAWSHGGYFPDRKPMAAGDDGVLYLHEDGYSDDGAARAPFIEYAPFDVRDGSVRATVSEVIVDMSLSEDATVTLKAREFPKGPERTVTLTVTPTTPRATTRISGAQIGFRIDFDGETYTRLSSLRGNVAEAGTR